MKLKIIGFLTVLLNVLSAPVVALDETVKPQSSIVDSPLLVQKSGYKLGSFILKPDLAMIGVYDNNIFATRTGEVSDKLLLVSPSLDIQSNWKRHQVRISSSADLAYYDEQTSEDYEDFNVGISGRYDLSKQANLFSGFKFSQGHESRASPDSFFGRNPTVFSSTAAHVGTVQQAGNVAMRLGGTYQNLDYKDVLTTTTPLNHDDRDRDLYGLGLRFSYVKDKRWQPFVQFIYDRREYQTKLDDNGFHRDSDGYRAAAGFISDISRRLRAEVYGGYLWQDYADNRFKTINKADFGASLRWRVADSTLVSASIDRAIDETTLAGSSSGIETSYGANLSHKLLPDIMFKTHLNYSKFDYQQISREDDYIDAGGVFQDSCRLKS